MYVGSYVMEDIQSHAAGRRAKRAHLLVIIKIIIVHLCPLWEDQQKQFKQEGVSLASE